MIAAQKSASASNQNPAGHLRHITEEHDKDALTEVAADSIVENDTNDTNEEELIYFARLKNHYLRLV